MRRYHVKIVRDDRPNEDGRWVEHWHNGELGFDAIVQEGTHVAAIREIPLPPQDQPFYQHSVLYEGRK